MVGGDAVDQDDDAVGMGRAQGKDRLIGGRLVPGAGPGAVREGDDDEVTGHIAFERLGAGAVDEETAAERRQGGVDTREIGGDRGAEGDLAQMGDGVGGERHGCVSHGSVSPGSVSARRRRGARRWSRAAVSGSAGKNASTASSARVMSLSYLKTSH